jgi:hypothetical protein
VTFIADCRNWKHAVWKVIFNTLFNSNISKEVKQLCFNEENNSCKNINYNMNLIAKIKFNCRENITRF